MAKNIYSLSATILRQKAYNEGRRAASLNKTAMSCPYDILKDRANRDVWFQGYDNYNYERELRVEEYRSFI